MKFQKGLLDDLKDPRIARESRGSPDRSEPLDQPRQTYGDDRLFQTHRRATRSWKQYLSMLVLIGFFVAVTGGVIFYLTLPGKGDQVRPPRGLEAAVRTRLLDVEKRNSGDIIFYYCEAYYWARVEVEKRPDIKTNPVYQIGSYAARGVSVNDSEWEITAAPITAAELDVPCS